MSGGSSQLMTPISPDPLGAYVRWSALAATVYVIGALVLHVGVRRGVMRQGMPRWRVRDTVGAFPLSLVGAAVLAASIVAVRFGAPAWIGGLGVALGAVWMTFGARAYLKLTR
jgi:hypothetical protein